MAGASKARQKKEKKASASSNVQSSASEKAAGPSKEVTPPTPGKSPVRYDGNDDSMEVVMRDPNKSRVIVDNRRLDLSMAGWSVCGDFTIPEQLPQRPAKYNSLGKEITIGLNTFNVLSFPSNPVYQYDVLMGRGDEKRGLVKRLWESKAVQEKIGKGWIFDGNRIAWSLHNFSKELRITVNLDEEAGRPPRKTNGNDDDEARNIFKVYIKMTNTVKFDALNNYLAKKTSFDNACLEAINFLDHLMRESPSKKYTQIRKNFFSRGNKRTLLGGGVEAFKGVFSSIRAVNSPTGARLSVNVDVANGTFWTESTLHLTAQNLLRARDTINLGTMFLKHPKRVLDELKKLRKLSVYVIHRGKETKQTFIIKRFLDQDAKTFKFLLRERNPKTGEYEDKGMITIFDYFRMKYNIILQFWQLPVVEMTKKGCIFPMEVCKIIENQRYVFKLDDRQTSEMIKFAVTLPAVRWEAVQHGLEMLDWSSDTYLKNYGMKIDTNQSVVKARLLPAPKIKFGNIEEQAIPAKGKWDLKGPKKFLAPNKIPLKSWGVCVVSGRMAVDKPTAEHFAREFRKIYTGHGGIVVGDPVIRLGDLNKGGEMVSDIWKATGDQNQLKPQILIFILPERDSLLYQRIKRACECRYGVVSQLVQSKHVQTANPQYISNVCMKFNAKLGGITSWAKGLPMTSLAGKGIMCIGADVSHASPGSMQPSMAAFTVSMNLECTRYAAQCDTNGHRVEMITTGNIDKCLGKLFRYWMTDVGSGALPKTILYFRDGVSEGQYQHVLDQEVRDVKALCKSINPKVDPKFLVIVASKRHHVRFFPNKSDGDRNGNALPGTLVESGVTHPFEFDFYLCAHAAIKGTARPVHYHVLLNETTFTGDALQQMIYEHSYHYARSTTPVSLFPAVYYAHLASNRAKAHEQAPDSSKDRKDAKDDKPPGSARAESERAKKAKDAKEKGQTGTSSEKVSTEYKPLMNMHPQMGIDYSMWYI